MPSAAGGETAACFTLPLLLAFARHVTPAGNVPLLTELSFKQQQQSNEMRLIVVPSPPLQRLRRTAAVLLRERVELGAVCRLSTTTLNGASSGTRHAPCA